MILSPYQWISVVPEQLLLPDDLAEEIVMKDEQLFYVNPETGEIYIVKMWLDDDSAVQIISCGTDCLYGVRVEYAMSVQLPQWKNRNTYEFSQQIRNLLPGTTQVDSLQDVLVWFYEGTYADSKYPDEDLGPKVWTLDDSSLRNIWRSVPVEGRKISLKWVPPGTRLCGIGARRLFEVAFGNMSVDRDADVFLGEWRIAAQVHIDRMLAQMPAHSDDWEGEHNLRRLALISYLKSSNMMLSPHEQVKLADAFIGRGWACGFIAQGIYDASSETPWTDGEHERFQVLNEWYLGDFLHRL